MGPRTLDETFAESASAYVQISDHLVEKFAQLSGDRSTLHVSDAIARRSAYRRPVAHGMLSVALLPLLPQLRVKGLLCSPVAVSARFASPVFLGDTLHFSASLAGSRTPDSHPQLDFRIVRADNGAPVTTGTLVVAYRDTISQPPAENGEDAQRALLADPVELEDVRLEQIEIGQTDVLDFRISSAALERYAAFLSLATNKMEVQDASELLSRVLPANMLALLLFSTSVGMRMPGASATFLEFSASFDADVKIDTDYRLEGQVVHRSVATRIIKKQMLVAPTHGGPAVMSGRVAALVNKPAGSMPTIAELRAVAMDWGLANKVAIVTGGSRGIGETTAKLLALTGARVIVNYHRGGEDAARVVKEITDAGGEALAVRGDISNPTDVATLAQTTLDRYGAIDVLVNNAARDFRPVPFLQLTWDEVQRDLDVIAKGAFLCCKAVIPSMIAGGGGKIINISTVATDIPPQDQAKYVIAKSALVGLTRSLAVDFAAKNIQVNMVVPGFVDTDFVAHVPDGFKKKIAQDTPMRRLASPIDVARAVVMLASAYSSFTTGQKIMVTGGSPPYL
jgi:3-oxoacyl-[acyl-carrier protein] reductase